jgi:hypothetical protein
MWNTGKIVESNIAAAAAAAAATAAAAAAEQHNNTKEFIEPLRMGKSGRF